LGKLNCSGETAVVWRIQRSWRGGWSPSPSPSWAWCCSAGSRCIGCKYVINYKNKKKVSANKARHQILSKVDYLSKSDSLVGVMEEMYRKVERIEIWQKKLTKDFKDNKSVDL